MASPNLLKRDFGVGRIDHAWAGDITYLWTHEGWLYLAVVLDLGSRRSIGWSMDNSIDTRLVLGALEMAIATRGSAKGVLFHSDRGSQYGSELMQAKYRELGIVASMSRTGNCWDNAVVESFFATLKTELVDGTQWKTRREAKSAVVSWIEGWYNRERSHSTLGYLSPAEYELQIAKSH